MTRYFFIVFLICVKTIFALSSQDYDAFPLKGGAWLFGKGINNRIYPSVSKSVPTHLILATFPATATSGDIVLQWAVLNALNYKSTGHMLNEAWKQFQNNKTTISINSWMAAVADGRDTLMSLDYRFAPDTIWSCDSNFNVSVGYSPKRVIYHDSTGNYDTIDWNPPLNLDRKRWLWHRKNPVAWGEKSFHDDSMKKKYTEKSNMYQFMDSATVDALVRDHGVTPVVYTRTLRSVVDSRGDFVNYCEDRFNKCYEQIECTSISTPPTKFWSVHLFPLVKWYPRQPQTGQPLVDDSLVMSTGQAKKMRSLSLKSSDVGNFKMAYDSIIVAEMGDTLSHLNMNFYRKPYLADSMSCFISVQFLPPDNTNAGYINTAIKDTEDSRFQGFYVDRMPDRIVRVGSNPGNKESVLGAILRLYAENASDDDNFKSIFRRCGSNWTTKDIEIGEKYRFPARMVGKSISGWRFDAGGTTDELVMDTNYYEPRFVYDGCPCLPIRELQDFSAADLRGITYRMPPMCDVVSMSNALYVLLEARKYLTNANDLKMLYQRIAMLGKALDIRTNTYRSLTAAQKKNVLAFCPDSWEKSFRDNTGRPLFESEYKPYMRVVVDSIANTLTRER